MVGDFGYAESGTGSTVGRSTRKKERKSYAMDSDSEDEDGQYEEDEDEEEDEAEGEDDDETNYEDQDDKRRPGSSSRTAATSRGQPVAARAQRKHNLDLLMDDDAGVDTDADDGLPLGAVRGPVVSQQVTTAPGLATANLPGNTNKDPRISKSGLPSAGTSHTEKALVTDSAKPSHAGGSQKIVGREEEDDDEDDDDDDLSELGSSSIEEDQDEEADEVESVGDEDAEGELDEDEVMKEAEGEDEEEDDEEDEEDEEDDEDADANASNSNNMTKRQRLRVEFEASNSFLQLPMEPQVKKHLSAEEHAMRRAEMARRRKNLSEKRNEEEKIDTINKLLKKQATKRRGKISNKEKEQQERGEDDEDGDAAMPNNEESESHRIDPTFVRWINRRQGSILAVPNEWLEGPLNTAFGAPTRQSNRLVEEIV